MSFNLVLRFIGLCALAKKRDLSELQVLLPDSRTPNPALSYGDGTGMNKKRFFPHSPYVVIGYDNIALETQKNELDYVIKDDGNVTKEGVLVLQGDILGLINYTSTSSLQFNANYQDIPSMDQIYYDTGGVSISPSLTSDPTNLTGLVARMTIRQGEVTSDERAESLFKFLGRNPIGDPLDPNNHNNYDKGYDFARRLVVTIVIDSDTVDLKIGSDKYTLQPVVVGGNAQDVVVTVANMPPRWVSGGSEFDLTVLDDTKEDYDFELVYLVSEFPITGKPRIPIKYRNKPPAGGGLPAGTRPPQVCGLASFNDY